MPDGDIDGPTASLVAKGYRIDTPPIAPGSLGCLRRKSGAAALDIDAQPSEHTGTIESLDDQMPKNTRQHAPLISRTTNIAPTSHGSSAP